MENLCKYCNREINNKGSLCSHQLQCNKNPDRIFHPRSPRAGAQKGSVSWARGLTKDTDPRIAKNAAILKKSYESGKIKPHCTPHSEETKRRLSAVAKERNLGGYVKGSGRGKKGWFKGFFCDSSWELAYVIWCLDHNIIIQRNTQKFEYSFNDKVYNFIPDFIVENKFVEIKGYETEQWNAKKNSFPHELEIIEKNKIKPILEYVKEKYGKNFLELYE